MWGRSTEEEEGNVSRMSPVRNAFQCVRGVSVANYDHRNKQKWGIRGLKEVNTRDTPRGQKRRKTPTTRRLHSVILLLRSKFPLVELFMDIQ